MTQMYHQIRIRVMEKILLMNQLSRIQYQNLMKKAKHLRQVTAIWQ